MELIRRITSKWPSPAVEYPQHLNATTDPPIFHLPYELLTRIFLEGRRRDEWSRLSATSVCRHWRNIIVNMPELWTHIDLDDTPKYPNPAWIKIQMERSKDLPLDINIRAWEYETPPFHPILPHYKRIQSLDISGKEHNLIEFLKFMRKKAFPALRKASVYIDEEYGYESNAGAGPPLPPLGGAGQRLLTSFDVGGHALYWFVPSLEAVTTLRLDFPLVYSRGQIHDYIHSANGLVELALSHITQDVVSEIPSLSLPLLRTLRIRALATNADFLTPFQLLQRLSSPSLDTLILEGLLRRVGWGEDVELKLKGGRPLFESVTSLEIHTDSEDVLPPLIWKTLSQMLPFVKRLAIGSATPQRNLFPRAMPYFKDHLEVLAMSSLDIEMARNIIAAKENTGIMATLQFPKHIFSYRWFSEPIELISKIVTVEVGEPCAPRSQYNTWGCSSYKIPPGWE